MWWRHVRKKKLTALNPVLTCSGKQAMGYFHEKSWKLYNGWEGRDGEKGRACQDGARRGRVPKVCSQPGAHGPSFIFVPLLTISTCGRRETFMEGFLWRAGGGTWCYNNYFSFFFSSEESFPFPLGLVQPRFQGSLYPKEPQVLDVGCVEQDKAQLRHCCTLCRKDPKREGKPRGKHMTLHPSPTRDSLQLSSTGMEVTRMVPAISFHLHPCIVSVQRHFAVMDGTDSVVVPVETGPKLVLIWWLLS